MWILPCLSLCGFFPSDLEYSRCQVSEILARRPPDAPERRLKLLQCDAWEQAGTRRQFHGWATVRVENGAGAFLTGEYPPDGDPGQWEVVVETPTGQKAFGELWLPYARDEWNDEFCTLERVPFEWPDSAQPATQDDFQNALKQKYYRLQVLNTPGKPLFQLLGEGAKFEAGGPAGAETIPLQAAAGSGDSEFDRTFDLFSGGRALQENLQLDRLRGIAGDGEANIPIESIEGITTKSVDFKARLADQAPEVEPLSRWVPCDQMLVSFKSFQAMADLFDEMERRGGTFLYSVEARSEAEDSRARTERQLCLSLGPLSRLLGPQVIRSVALTMSDPYLREGTDVALLFECSSKILVEQNLALGWVHARKLVPGVEDVSGEHGGIHWKGVVSPQRSVSSYSASVDDVVLVSNSLAQLERLLDAHSKATPAHGDSDEFRFFRVRYPWVGDGKGALVVMSDAFLRRLSGPRWRISESRRLLCAAIQTRLNALRCVGAGEDAQQLAAAHDLHCPETRRGASYWFDSGGAVCSIHGGAGFLTPIAELEVTHVRETERSAYERFRDNYQRYWRQVYDPVVIAVSAGDPVEIDLTVLPLIEGTDYTEFRDFAMGEGVLTDKHGDPHEGTIVHWLAHVNPQALVIKQLGEFATVLPGFQPRMLSWIGDSVEMFIENGPVWEEMAKAENVEEFMTAHLTELPMAFRITVRDPFSFALLVTTVRAFIDSTLPGAIRWENHELEELRYVAVHASPEMIDPEHKDADVGVFYGGVGGAWWLSFNEECLKSALQRGRSRLPPKEGQAPASEPAPGNWLGDHLAAELDVESLLSLTPYLLRPKFEADRMLCLANLPILEEWHSRFPERDPVEVQLQTFGARPVCPSGGRYSFDPDQGAMVCEHHGGLTSSRVHAEIPVGIRGFERLRAGLTFEDDGLRVRLKAKRSSQ